MWLWMALGSAVLLGFYDVAKKQALKKNDVYYILLGSTLLSSVFLCPFLEAGTVQNHLRLIVKAVLVSLSWVSGMIALKQLPITITSTIKASRPVFVVLLSVLLFSERLNAWQWAGVLTVFAGLWLLSRSGSREGIDFRRNRGVWAMFLSVAAGVASALYDKHIIKGMDPLFVQGWANVYITVILAAIVLIRAACGKGERFRMDWTIVLIALLITAADALYFFSLKQEGSLLSVVSTVRRFAVVVTFAVGAAVFKEKNLLSKGLALGVLLGGIILLIIGSN